VYFVFFVFTRINLFAYTYFLCRRPIVHCPPTYSGAMYCRFNENEKCRVITGDFFVFVCYRSAIRRPIGVFRSTVRSYLSSRARRNHHTKYFINGRLARSREINERTKYADYFRARQHRNPTRNASDDVVFPIGF